MSTTSGLKEINDVLSKGSQSGDKKDWVKLKDGESVKVHFLQELDEDAENYQEDAGLGFIAVEWADPLNFQKKILDTSEEGGCWPAEQRSMGIKRGGKEWKPSRRLYINVLVESEGENEGKVMILSQGIGNKSITPSLVEYAGEVGSIRANPFKIKRTGSGMNDTSYTLTPLPPYKEVPDASQYELADLDKVVRHVPYENQEAFFTEEEDGSNSGNAASSQDNEW